MSEYRVDFESVPWNFPAPGVRVKVVARGDHQLRLVEFAREFSEPDWCPKGHIGYVLDGEMELAFENGRKVLLHAGDGIFIPPGAEHGHKGSVLSRTATVVLVEEI